MPDNIDLYDRVVFKNTFKKFGITVTAGTIGTCRQILNDGVYVVQYSYDNQQEMPKYIGVEASALKTVTHEELQNVEYIKHIIPKVYHPGSVFIIDNKEVIIKKVKLALNEQFDEYICDVENGEHLFTKIQIDAGSMDYIKSSEQLLVQSSKEPEKNEDITINIDGISFMVSDGIITIPPISLKTIDSFATAVNKFNRFVNQIGKE